MKLENVKKGEKVRDTREKWEQREMGRDRERDRENNIKSNWKTQIICSLASLPNQTMNSYLKK